LYKKSKHLLFNLNYYPMKTSSLFPGLRHLSLSFLLVIAWFSLFPFSSVKAQWQYTGGPLNQSIAALVVNGSNLIAASNYPGGIYLSNNEGATWTAAAGLTNIPFYSLAISGSNIFAGSYTGVYLSTNNGTTWTHLSNGLSSYWIRSMAASGSNIFAGTDAEGIYRSTDNGSTWSVASTGLGAWPVYCLEASGSSVFAGTDGGGVYHSSNTGSTWTSCTGSYTWDFCLKISGSNLFLGTSNGGAFISTDNGSTFTAINTGLTSWVVRALAVYGSNVYAATYDGVFRSTDNGAHWFDISDGLQETSDISLAVTSTNLLVGINQSGNTHIGVWKRSLSQAASVPEFQESDGFTVTPNPMSVSACIELKNPAGTAQLSVVDLLGKVVYKQYISASKFNLEKGDLRPGLYIIRLMTGEKGYHGKLMVQ
jgi:photosystem II stability/assembly factor-like uncharacterized protein